MAKVIVDLQRAQDNGCSKLTAEIFSPGGAVVVGLEIVRRMREAERAGLVIETRGGALVASMATVILAAGTPGHRFTSHYTLTVIHAIRGGFMGECLSLVPDPQTEGTKIANELITTLAVALAELTGNPSSVTLGWLECGKEQVGSGGLLVDLGFADHLIEG